MKKYKTKSDIIYDYLSTKIATRNLSPGDKIIIRDISRKLNVSDIPVREAIKKLETNGLVSVTPHMGARITRINRDEVEELYNIMSELEGLATRLSVKYLKDSDFDKLQRILDKYNEVLHNGKHEKLPALNRQFHLNIYKCSPYKNLLKMIVNIWEKSQMMRTTFQLPSSIRKKSLSDHQAILKYLRNGDGKTAAELTRKQKMAALAEILELIEE